MNNLEKILVFATLITPFTLLRIGFLGFGEISIVLLLIYSLQKGYVSPLSKQLIFSGFWAKFLIIALCGLIYNVLFLDHKTGTFEGMLFDLSAYIMLFVSCLIIESLYKKRLIDFGIVLRYVFIFGGIIYLLLYIVSLFSNTLFGLPLKYHTYFAPLVKNLHQTAMFIGPLAFLGLFVMEQEKNKVYKLIFLLFSLAISYMVMETGSFKAYAGLILAWGVYLIFKLVGIFTGDLKKAVIAISVLSIILIGVFNADLVFEKGEAVFKEEDQTQGRSVLYSNAMEVGYSSPLIGLGPGPHVFKTGKFWDSHETFITVFLQSGVIGLVLFLILFLRISRKMLKEPALLTAFIPIFIYALGGDILRRLPVWFLLLFFYYYIESTQNNQATLNDGKE